MDVATLTKEVVVFLAPFLPYLLKAGEKAAEEAGKKLGGDAWEQAKALWSKLRPKVEAKPAAQEAVQDMAQAPANKDAQVALRLQLKKLLTEDTALAQEIAWLTQDSVVQRVLAERGSVVREVEQMAEGGETRQEVITRDESTVEGVKQVRRS
jgi:hypothetical protein